jgi:hypothetical protein
VGSTAVRTLDQGEQPASLANRSQLLLSGPLEHDRVSFRSHAGGDRARNQLLPGG